MPKIAQYEANQVSTQIARQPLAQDAPPGAFGGQVVAGVFDVVKAAADIKQRVDTTSAEEALVQFERDKNDVFFNPESGYFNTLGRDAYNNSSAATKSLEDLKLKYGESLSVQSKLMFDRAADKHITRSQMDIARHASKGLKAWEVSTIESQVENSIENASLYWDDEEQLKVQSVVGRRALLDSSEMLGLGPEATAEKLQTFESSFARNTIEAATQSSADNGKDALEKYGDRLEGPDKVKMEGLIEKKTEVEKTASDARAAVLISTKLVDQHDIRADIIAEVNKIEDPDLRKKTMTEVTTQFNRKKQAEKEQSNESYQSIIGQVNAGATAGEIQAKNSDAWVNMTDAQRNNILSGKHMITDQILLSNLRSLPTVEKAKLNATDYSDRLKPADLQKLTGEINAAKKGDPGSRVKALSSKANAAAEGAYGKKSKWQKKSGGLTERGIKANQFLNDLQDALDDFVTENDRKASPAEEDQIINEFTRDILIKRSALGFDFLASDIEIDLSNAPPNDVRLLNRIIDSTPDIDLNDLVGAYQYLVDNKQQVTLGKISEVYRQGRQ